MNALYALMGLGIVWFVAKDVYRWVYHWHRKSFVERWWPFLFAVVGITLYLGISGGGA